MNPKFDHLTEREKEALRLFGRGHDAKSAARVLQVSVNSINERLREARRKLEVSTSREAARVLLETEAGSAQEAWDKKIGLDERPAGVAGYADPHRRRVKDGSLLAIIGVGAMLLIAATALVSLTLTDFPASETKLEPDYSVSIEVKSSALPLVQNNIKIRSGAIASVSRSDAYGIHFSVMPDPDRAGNARVSANIVIQKVGATMRYSRTMSVPEGDSARFELEPIGPSRSPIDAVVITPRRVKSGS